jgi:hypothetical protein
MTTMDHRRETFTVDELHDEVRHVTTDAGLEELDETRMLEASKGLRLERCTTGVFGIGRTNDLDGDLRAKDLVSGTKDVRHPAASQDGAKAVSPVE